MSRADTEPSLLDDAARAGWLYYVGGMTQDQIASELGISRQRAQRLVSRAMAEGLIQVRLNHPIGASMDLAARLKQRFGLSICRVVPGLGPGADPAAGIAGAAAAELERILRSAAPLTIGFGTGRALRALVEALEPLAAPQHRLVSLIGNIAPDGSASFFDVVMRLADRVMAPHYPMLVPVVSPTAAERAGFHALAPVQRVLELARAADVVFVGVGQMSEDAPLQMDGFVSAAELREMQAAGAAGEIAGWVFDSEGRYLDFGINTRTGGVRVEPDLSRPAIGIAAGASKVPGIHAALKSRIINGLVTDAPTAEALLSRP
ncbi:sugar-binding transcriptional regulator [Pseudogemmobacter bohemicus]|uniref:sugar-binding transcriptional regulator n=1 Tax=Pseudogemmobacter bohemicus TaxID=2250708 RepID=UPI000DD49AB4|nr:sugar-binding domain-containing protein [Pseudogemmobacter bohemicus]